ncbi:unnamed protein product [Arabidopsis arenosa]|uniref:Uncharacterized protein n=1 Tax=Arabidopsis arenosa TaxID=38785 RepID=A0A8S1ZQ05_ARAAE|nr:unnamed protein product [Arabidopsis arenosa]
MEIPRSTEISKTLLLPATILNPDEDVPEWKDQITIQGLISSALRICFLGLFSLLPLRKVMILDYKLKYPSGTATVMLINSFHNNTGTEVAGGIGDACGFDHFPTLGMTLFKNTPTFIGCGMICPHLVNCSVLLGAIISWGFLWPFISQHARDRYPTDLEASDFRGLYGYKVK